MNTVHEAMADVGHAFRHLEFAIRLMCYCELDLLDRERFDSDVSILLDRKNVGFPSGTFATTEDTVTSAQALVGVCFGVSAIVLDAAFDVAGLKNKPCRRIRQLAADPRFCRLTPQCCSTSRCSRRAARAVRGLLEVTVVPLAAERQLVGPRVSELGNEGETHETA